MKSKSTFSLALICLFALVLLIASHLVKKANPTDSRSPGTMFQSGNGVTFQNTPPKGILRSKRQESKSFDAPELVWQDYKVIEWTTNELDNYLSKKSKELKGPEMADTISYLFPGPSDSEPRANKLKPGSIPLVEQFRICRKYLNSGDFAVAISSIWTAYQNSGSIIDFRREIINRIEPGTMRTELMANYCQVRSKDYLAFADFLESAELKEIQAPNNLSDIKGIQNGLETSIRDIIVNDEKFASVINEKLRASDLNDSIKIKLIDGANKVAERVRQSRN